MEKKLDVRLMDTTRKSLNHTSVLLVVSFNTMNS